MSSNSPLLDFWHSMRHLASHAAITLVAVAIAFSLPKAASYILYNWWPRMMQDTQLLLYVEIGFAASLVLLLNLIKLSWGYRSRARMTSIASLVYARESDDWLSRWVRDNHLKHHSWKRDLAIKAVTGYGTFAANDSSLGHIIRDCYELRVMLLNPFGRGAEDFAASHADPQATLAEMRREVAASIAALRDLHGPGKNISLKFYDESPFWKLVFIGDHVWMRCCHCTRDRAKFPEYVFALQPQKPNRGFFPAFYTHFLNLWNNPCHPEYAFDSDELVYRDAQGSKLRCMPFPGVNGANTAAIQQAG